MLGVYINAKRRTVDELEYKFRSTNSTVKGNEGSLWQEFHVSVFKTNNDGIIDSVEGEDAPFDSPLLGSHFTRAFAGKEAAFERAARNGYSNFVVHHKQALYAVNLHSRKEVDETVSCYGFIRKIGDDERNDGFQEEVIGIVSHELKNPLSSVLGALKLIKGGAAGELPDKADALLDIARNNGERLLHLLNDIIDVEKIEAGTLEFQFEPCEIYKTVEESVLLNGAFAQAHGVTLELQGDFNPLKVRMDKGRILQVLTNFISNAVKFSPEGNTVFVRMLTEDGHVRVEVEDEGPGIPVEFRHKIFQKFAHREPQRESMRAGAGLGLSISKAIVERHDGQIGFDTEEDKGTTFYFILKAD
jgi:signal transduction histidine kinase